MFQVDLERLQTANQVHVALLIFCAFKSFQNGSGCL